MKEGGKHKYERKKGGEKKIRVEKCKEWRWEDRVDKHTGRGEDSRSR